MTKRILIAEDDIKQAELVRMYLDREGHTIVVVHDGRAALEQARQKQPDLIILDVMMPKVDGLDVCRILRAESDVPILMLTARSTEDDLLLGLDLGADDYVTKPYSPRELVARVRAVLRRASAGSQSRPIYQIGQLEVDSDRHEVRLSGKVVDCTPAEFQLLETLSSKPGHAFSRQRLLEAAFGFDHYAIDRTIDVHVMNLRRKIESDVSKPAYLLTVYGVGYKMADDTNAS